MKLTTTFFLIGLILGLLTFFTTTAMANAGDHQAIGSIGIETPIGMTPNRPQDNTPTVLGNLHLTHLLGPVGVYGAFQVQTKRGVPYQRENKFQVGVEAPLTSLGLTGVTAYSYFERRFDTMDNRFMVGCRWGFSQHF